MASVSPFDTVIYPSLAELPFRKGDPDGAIWGFYEHVSGAPAGQKDELGALNLLTPSRILKAAREEIQFGKVCSLNWALQKPVPPPSNRRQFEHKVTKWPGEKFIVDDEIVMNTQSSSQWDGFLHYGYYKTGEFYNGLRTSELFDDNGKPIPSSVDTPRRNGIHAFQGKIVGRGVLLDYYSWATKNGITYTPYDKHFITAEQLDKCAESQGVFFNLGDILFIRTGYIDWYENTPVEQRTKQILKAEQSTGLHQGKEEIEWLWNHHFAAVVADNATFEGWPSNYEHNLHDYLLAMWGTPIGELFDLEDLAKTCRELGRYSFFVTSSPLNVVNGVASPPNALAIF